MVPSSQIAVLNDIVRPNLLNVVFVDKVLISVEESSNLVLEKSVKTVRLGFGCLQFSLGLI